MEIGDFSAACGCFRQALELAPDFAEAYANLGLLLDKGGRLAEAEDCYRHSLALNPDYSQTHLNFGAFLTDQKRFKEALAAYVRAIEISPRSPMVWSNLGVLYACMLREEEAEQCYCIAMDLDDTYANARFNLSYLLLRQGRFEEGWYCLEARNWYAALTAHFECPRWRGESLSGKSLLIGYEAGHGDMIQFSRYAAVLKAQGAAQITLLCHPALKTLFSMLDAVDTVISFDEPIPKSGWDFWTPPLSIPYYCKTRSDSIPAAIPYLQAPPERLAKWASALPRDGLRVGLVWKGSPQFENDHDRSLPGLEVLIPLGSVTGVRFVSLQKGAGEDEARQPPAGLPLIDLGARIEDFADSAAIVTGLDLVICVDTAIAHLAGALGKTCWVLLPAYKADWRWLAGRRDTPWYPEIMRLFRQSTMGNWTTVIAEVVAALEEWVIEKRSLAESR